MGNRNTYTVETLLFFLLPYFILDPRSDHIGWSTKTKLKRRVTLDEDSASLTRYEINIIKEVVAKVDEVERKEEKRVR